MEKRVLKKGETTSKYASIISMVFSLVKGITGWYTGSVALMADAVNSFSDIFASLAVYLGLRFSQKKATEQFPYGYYKAETFASLLVSVLIVAAGITIFKESVSSFLNPHTIVMAPYALIVVGVSAAGYFIMARYKIKTGKEIGSLALINDGNHSLVDTASSGLVFLGIALSHRYPHVEAVAGIIISVFVVKTGIEQGRYAVLVLLDAWVHPALVEKTREIAEAVPGVEGVHDVKLRRSGPFAFGEMHLETKGTFSVKKAHKITEEVEKKIKKEIPTIDSMNVYIEPRKGPLKVCTIAVPLNNDKGMQSEVSHHVGKALFFVIATIKEGVIYDWCIVKNPAAHAEKKRGVIAAEFLAEKEVDILVTEESGKGLQYALEAKKIEVREPAGKTLEEIIACIIEQPLTVNSW